MSELTDKLKDFIAKDYVNSDIAVISLREIERLEKLLEVMQMALDGWVMVPRKHTQAMCDAGFDAQPLDQGRFDNYPEQHRLAMMPKWKAMINASPKPCANQEYSVD